MTYAVAFAFSEILVQPTTAISAQLNTQTPFQNMSAPRHRLLTHAIRIARRLFFCSKSSSKDLMESVKRRLVQPNSYSSLLRPMEQTQYKNFFRSSIKSNCSVLKQK